MVSLIEQRESTAEAKITTNRIAVEDIPTIIIAGEEGSHTIVSALGNMMQI